MIASGRILLACLTFAATAALVAPQTAEAASAHRRSHRARQVVASIHHRPAHHVTRLARSGGSDTVRIIRAHSRAAGTLEPVRS